MPLQAVVLELDAPEADALSDACFEAGALSVSIDDPLAGTPDEVAVYGEPGNEKPGNENGWPRPEDAETLPGQAEGGWPRLRLQVLLAETADARRFVEEASRAAGLAAPPAYQVELLADDDWVKKTQAQFQPIRISARLWIVPSWHAAPDPAAINILLDPGAAFGTGSHPTTQLCLRWLEAHVTGGDTVLDYGCGSGILAIAAARLGAGRVAGVDIDPAAVEAARANAQRNGVAVTFFGSAASDFAAADFRADILVANILTNPLKLLAPVLAARVRPGGLIALSGVLTEQAADTMRAYAPWFDFEPAAGQEGWVCLSGRRRA
jgi:ribosomal protein L11 methyltransferase